MSEGYTEWHTGNPGDECPYCRPHEAVLVYPEDRKITIDQHTGGVEGWTIDHEADAAYLLLTRQPIVETVNFGVINLDLDKGGKAVGIELLTLHTNAPREGTEVPT